MAGQRLPRQLRVMWENSRCSIWDEMQPRMGARQLTGRSRGRCVLPAGYPAAMMISTLLRSSPGTSACSLAAYW
jgi:hypothetical protein